MRYVARILPALVTALLTLLAALPWGIGSQARFVLALLPLTAIHYFTVRRPAAMPPAVAFAAGLATDALTHGPLGYWALVFLVGQAATRVLRDSAGAGALGRLVLHTIVLALASAAGWAVAAVYFMEAVDARPMMLAVAIAVALHPVSTLLLGAVERLAPRPSGTRLARGA